MGEDFVLDAAFAAQQAEQFRSDQVGRIVQNAVTTTSVDTVSLDRDVFNGIDPTTSERLDSWSVTNQRHSATASTPARRTSTCDGTAPNCQLVAP